MGKTELVGLETYEIMKGRNDSFEEKQKFSLLNVIFSIMI